MLEVFLCFLLATTVYGEAANDDWLTKMLDSMVTLSTGGDTFDRDYLGKLKTCLSSQNRLTESQNSGWQEMVQYFVENGTGTDQWGSCWNTTECKAYQEYNATALDVEGVIIYEPCNYVSNVAYYHVSTELCANGDSLHFNRSSLSALIEGYATLAYGSAFWHGSHTLLGNVCDNRFIDLVAFTMYQAGVEHYPASYILHDLSILPRKGSGITWTQDLVNLFIDADVDTWYDFVESMDVPQYYLTFSAIVANVFSLTLDNNSTLELVNVLADAFNLPPEDKDFIINTYLPQLWKITDTIELTTMERTSLLLKTTGSVMKLLYAFAWQEWVFPTTFFMNPTVNKIGAKLMPYVNQVADFLTGFPTTDPAMKNSQNLYPGDDRCRVEQPHSKWHEESADGLLALIYLTDYQITLTNPAFRREQSSIFSVYDEYLKFFSYGQE